MPHQLFWYILLLPFFSFVIISLIMRPFFSHRPKLSGYITIAAIASSLGLSLWGLLTVMGAPHHELEIPPFQWLVVGTDLTIKIGLLVDSLTAVMLVVVTLVSLMVQIYSQGYMKPQPGNTDYSETGYCRYFGWMSLFTGFMLSLVMSDNLLLMYLGWEGVGLCSYLLIGFWFHKPSAANAAKKAFIVTRLGDVGFLLAIIYLYLNTGTFTFPGPEGLFAKAGALSAGVLTWAALGIFSGAAGKSAQFPLHVWLPDAMEGPTPVSALIHAATMVAAGVFLVARTFPLFEHSPQALTVVATIGGFTAIFAATMGLVMNDIKRVVAYSTISQLGYMMLGLGSGGVAIGIFHLFNHAFFKALLFLGSGSVNHATGTFDMRQMGGLRKHMPWTTATFFVAALSLAGIWPLSGFWSKDEILAQAWETRRLVCYLAMITVVMTAFYIFRAFFLTFGGEYRGKSAKDHGSHGSHAHSLHESPPVMIVPMLVLAVLAIFSGFWGVGGQFSAFLGHGEEKGFIEGFFGIFAHPLPWISLALAFLGIFLAYAIYSAKWISAEKIGRTFRPLYTLFSHKYWFDEAYEKGVVGIGLLGGLFRGLELFDSKVVDGVVNGVANGSLGAGRGLRHVQTGQLQVYGIAIVVGILAILAAIYLTA